MSEDIVNHPSKPRGASSKDRHGVAYFRRYRAKKRELLDGIKAERRCLECGEGDPACLQFHHRNPADKVRTISRFYGGTWGTKAILAEIEKCDVLCANCHLKLHRRVDNETRI